MSREVICINDAYSEAHLIAFAKYGIKYPKKDELCEVIRVISYPKLKKTGFVIRGYENQWIKGFSSGIEGSNEVDFDSSRFVNLDQTSISRDEINEIKKELKLVEVL